MAREPAKPEQPLLDFEVRPKPPSRESTESVFPKTEPPASEPLAPQPADRAQSRTDGEPASGESNEDLPFTETPPAMEAPDAAAHRSRSGGQPNRPPVNEQLLARLADLLVHAAALAIATAAMVLMGMRPTFDQWPGFATYLLCFSFLYLTVPLAFWGQSPGMAWRGLRAQDHNRRSLTFGQTARRWFAALLTTVLLGLPLFLLFFGRSAADLLSSSVTVWETPKASRER